MNSKKPFRNKKIILAIACVAFLLIGIISIKGLVPHRFAGVSVLDLVPRTNLSCLFGDDEIIFSYISIVASIVCLIVLFKMLSKETNKASNPFVCSLGIVGITVFYALYSCDTSTVKRCTEMIATPFFTSREQGVMNDQIHVSEASAQNYLLLTLLCVGVFLVGLYIAIRPFGVSKFLHLLLNRKAATSGDPAVSDTSAPVCFCTQCGNPVPHGTSFCAQCGQKTD